MHMEAQQNLFILFTAVVLGFLIFDLGFLNRQAHRISFRSALKQSLFWVFVSVVFAGLIFRYIGHVEAAEFMSAYVTEKMLSVDNLFIIMLIFKSLKLEDQLYHRVLFWGILGAIFFRGIFISAGALLIGRFHWILYFFGAFLIYTGIRFFFQKDQDQVKLEESKIIGFVKKLFRFTSAPHGGHFFIEENGKYYATMLFMAVLMVETTDIIFALDSIPAVFAISQNPFIVFTSNIFAVMGLRALFFLIEGIIQKFHFLHEGLSFILVFIGAKMFGELFHLHISSIVSFVIVMAILVMSVVISIAFPKKNPTAADF
jgi:tellurite resistance protein TerC